MMDLVVKILFSAVIAIIIYVYAGYPLILFILGLFRRRRRPGALTEYPSVALIISAHNEEKIIRDKIENCFELDYPKDRLRIIIASDGSIDGTDDIVRKYEGPQVALKSFGCREGKSATLNHAVLGIEEEILVFSDANAFYKADALKKLVRNFTFPEVGCVVGRLIYLENHSYVGKGEGLYWRYETVLNSLESRLRSVLVATGTIFAIRRGLFRPVMKDVANDFQLPAEVASQGYGIVFEKEAVAYERSTYFFREEFNRKRRIIIRGLTGYKHLRYNFGGPLRVFQFVSRKLLRWWLSTLFPVLYTTNLLLIKEPLFLALFLLQNAFYLFAIIGAFLRRGKIQSKILFIPFYFVLVNAAAFSAILAYVGGGRFASWEKAETTRNVHESALSTPRLRVIEGKKKYSLRRDRKGLENLEKIT
jgi:cellulose synthase/poly-beta-1,6-N-acetylglucosamine synthase-like glycosyltransferase